MFNGLYKKEAYALTADDVLNKMNTDQQAGYFSGFVDGLAQARWIKDKPDQAGMNCIYNWYYKGGKPQQRRIQTWLGKHLNRQANGLLYVLIKRDCGE